MSLKKCNRCGNKHESKDVTVAGPFITRCGVCRKWVCDDCSVFCDADHTVTKKSPTSVVCEDTCAVELMKVPECKLIHNCLICHKEYGTDNEFLLVTRVN